MPGLLRATESGENREWDAERDHRPAQDGASSGGEGEDTESFLRPAGRTPGLMDAQIETPCRRALCLDRLQGRVTEAVPRARMRDTALDEYKTNGLAFVVFPTFFPYGLGSPTDKGRARAVIPTEGFKHLIEYASVDTAGRRTYRFVSHPRFTHWCQNVPERHRMLTQA